MQPYNRNLSSPWLIWSKLPVFTVLQLQFLVQEGWLWRINEIHYFSSYFTNVRAWPEGDLVTLFILLSSCESSDTACPHFHCVRGLWLKRVSFTKYSSCTEMFWCPSCQEQGIVGWPCSSVFREQGNVGAQSFEKGALNHRNSWPKCTNFLSSINKLHCLAWERANDHVVLHTMTFLGQPGPLGELKNKKYNKQ